MILGDKPLIFEVVLSHIDSSILKHPIYYVIPALDMTKLNHLAKTIGYSSFSSLGYATQS
jgi:hypothetical protein